jgi:hypothetical protein
MYAKVTKKSISNKDLTKQTIDRKAGRKTIIEKVPDEVCEMVVDEFLKCVGDGEYSDWREPLNVARLIAKIMSIDLDQPLEEQNPNPFELDRTIMIFIGEPVEKKTIPLWICQSLIRVDKDNGYIDYNGSKYSKIDIIFNSKYFKQRMDKIAKCANSTWKARWGNSKKKENRLYQKVIPGKESWLSKCVQHLLKEEEKEKGINIKDLVMIEFKRNV